MIEHLTYGLRRWGVLYVISRLMYVLVGEQIIKLYNAEYQCRYSLLPLFKFHPNAPDRYTRNHSKVAEST